MDKKKYSNSEVLLGDLREGIQMAHTHVFDSYADELNSYMAVICGNRSMAEDIVQETFVKFWDKRKKMTMKDLTPNQRANALNTDKELSIETIDIKDHLGWTDGVLVFYKDNMATIFKKLERKFNIRIENNYPKLESLSFSGRFSKKETLEEVLGTMRAHTYFSYSITNKNTLISYEPDNLESL